MTAGAHIAIGWALWTLAVHPVAPSDSHPLWVSLRMADAPPARALAEPHPAPAPPRVPAAAPAESPPLPALPPTPPLALSMAEPLPATAPAPRAAPADNEAAAAPMPAPPPPPRRLQADAVRYRVMPPAEVPLLSRRAGESGVVWLRVLIDTQGRPARIELHRSSGFRRLDEQALAAMAQARFAPRLEDGVAVEVEVIAPIEYPAD